MNLTYKLLQTEIENLQLSICNDVDANTEGKKFSLLILKKMSGYVGDKLVKSYTDGGGDHQVDGIYYEEENELQINIITCKFTQKENDPIKDKDVTDFIKHGLEFIVLGEDNGGNFNAKVRDMKSELDELRNQYKEKYHINVKFITTSNDVLSNNGTNLIEKFLTRLQPLGIDISYELINGTKLSSLFSSRYSPNTFIPIKLSGKSYYSLTTREGFICRLPVKELIKIYKGFKDGEKEYFGYHEYLFTDNVRRNLGLEKKINEKIYETATDPKMAIFFEYYNNGLTIIYDEKNGNLLQDSPVIFLKGMQVVNGCQTVSTLIEADNKGELCDEIYLTSRFIKRDNENNFIHSVITYTNSQNAITDRDLHSNDPIQYDIQGILRKMGIYYERKLNENKEELDDYRVDALDAAQAYLCCELKQPQTAKHNKRKIFNELYNTIFDSHSIDLPYKLFISHKTLEYALTKQSKHRRKKNKTKRQGKQPRFNLKDMIIAHGTHHIASILYNTVLKGKERSKFEKYSMELISNSDFYKKYEAIYDLILQDIENRLKHESIEKASVRNYFAKTDYDKIK